MNATVKPHELKQLMTNCSVVLVDVLPPEDFACCHIAGASNACIYEMVFLEKVAERVSAPHTSIVVYDESGTTLAARTAKEKLERAGYREVSILEGGLQGWQAAGLAVEPCGQIKQTATAHDGIYKVDTEKSVLEWVGRNINNRHYGKVTISEGTIDISDGRLVSGNLVLDMYKITNTDLQDENWRGILIRHLKSDDFFDVEHYPTATFEFRGAAEITAASPGTPNVEIAGSLTIKDTTRPICFPAIISPQDDGSIKAHAAFDLDRTNWNVRYGSGKLYERLGMHLVNDLISIELFIVAR